MIDASLNQEMSAALVDELGVVVGAMIDSTATVLPGTPATGRQWIGEIVAEGTLAGTMTVVLDHDGVTAITRLMTGIEGAIPDEALTDTLREVLAQAVNALTLKPVARAARLSLVDVSPAERYSPEGDWTGYAIKTDKLPTALAVTAMGRLTMIQAAAVSSPQSQSGRPSNEAAYGDRIDVILDIDLPLVVRFGRTELPLRTLTRLGPGSVIDLGRSPDDPVEVLVSNRVVARGEVVVVSGSYGIRILDVVSQRERVRSMEG